MKLFPMGLHNKFLPMVLLSGCPDSEMDKLSKGWMDLMCGVYRVFTGEFPINVSSRILIRGPHVPHFLFHSLVVHQYTRTFLRFWQGPKYKNKNIMSSKWYHKNVTGKDKAMWLQSRLCDWRAMSVWNVAHIPETQGFVPTPTRTFCCMIIIIVLFLIMIWKSFERCRQTITNTIHSILQMIMIMKRGEADI